MPIATLFWQPPWAGPRIDQRQLRWAVMPDPAYGDAWAICVPVARGPAGPTLTLAQPKWDIDATQARQRRWTSLPFVAGTAETTDYLCLLGYDQPHESDLGTPFTDGGQVRPRELQDVLELLHAQREQELAAALALPPAALSPLSRAGRRASKPAAQLTLAFASCQYPAGLMDGIPAQASYRRLAERIESDRQPAPSRLLLLGDQVYVDATAGLLDPTRLDDRYRLPYEDLLQLPALRRVMQRVPVDCMLDDHEINDNWEPYRKGATGGLYHRGLAAYWNYQRMRPVASLAQGAKARTWTTLRGPGWSIFMADSRTRRDHRCEADLGSARILGGVQTRALYRWLRAAPQAELKLVATPAMLLPRLHEHEPDPLHLDGWQGYPTSLHELLAFLCDRQIGNVCFLSGDAHLASQARATVTRDDGRTVRFRSFHAPALYAPLPFANEQGTNLAAPRDRFEFALNGVGYSCRVAAALLPGARDGSCLLQAQRDPRGWEVNCSVI